MALCEDGFTMLWLYVYVKVEGRAWPSTALSVRKYFIEPNRGRTLMADLVVTCPKHFYVEWIAEGDAAGDAYTGEEWGWYLGGSRPDIGPGDRLYVVAWGVLRGYAPVTRLARTERGWCICRRGDAVAVSIPEPIKGFQGWRRRWWDLCLETPFPEWKTYGVGESKRNIVDQALDEIFGGPGSTDRAIARAFKRTKR